MKANISVFTLEVELNCTCGSQSIIEIDDDKTNMVCCNQCLKAYEFDIIDLNFNYTTAKIKTYK